MRRDSVARARRTHDPVEVHGIIPALPTDDYADVPVQRLAVLVRLIAATLLLASITFAVPPVAAQDPEDEDVEDPVRPADEDDDDDDEPGPARRRQRQEDGRPVRRDREERPGEAAVPRLETVLRVRLEAQAATQGAVLGRTAFVPLRNGQLVRVDLEKGTIDGSMAIQATQAPAAGDGLVFVTTADALTAVDARGTIRWSLPLRGGFSAPPLWDNGWLIASTSSAEVLGVRAKDGHVLWTQHVGAPVAALPIIAGDRAYVPLRDGRLVALELLTGTVVWEQPLGGSVGAPLALDDRLFVGTSDRYFYCLATADGHERWRVRVGGTVVGAPVVDIRHVYFTALDNVLRALNRFNGSQVWMAGLPFRPLGGPLLMGDIVLVGSVGPEARGYSANGGRLALEHAGTADLAPAAPPQLLAVRGLPELTRILLLTRDPELQVLQRPLDVPVEPLRELIGIPVAIVPPPGF
jgi:outer membrane protein assembly factor BamB